ncbi:Maf family protein [Isoalcanivorax indicus]|uniref:Maf family protein n=1 Tax=Isoalcanivorax indicus TaxID=2202653 RepID=UPI000DB93CC0|nr:Maf family protein [Isoalcanivorax indicus]
MATPLFLASTSPRRAELLRQIGVPFSVLRFPGIDETPAPDKTAPDYVLRMAREKALAGAAAMSGSGVAAVLGADTSVVLGGAVLGKPTDIDDAAGMLRRLSGQTHEVLSAVALVCRDEQGQWNDPCTVLSTTRVTFVVLSAADIDAYLATGEPFDKAGGYGIQGYGAVLVASLAGSYSGVVGLPLTETRSLLTAAGVPLWQAPASP